MEGLFVVRVDDSGLPIAVEDGRPALQARSLANALKLCKRKLLKLKEEGVHTTEDVEHYKSALELMESDFAGLPPPAGEGAGEKRGIARDAEAYHACSRLLEECKGLLQGMEQAAAEMPEALRPVHARLADLHRRLRRMRQRQDHTLAEVVPLQAELDKADAERVAGGGFVGGAEVGEPSPGQDVCEELLNHCYELLADCLHTARDVSPAMRRAYNHLRHVKNALRRISTKEHHTVEELQHYQALLEKLDSQGLVPQGAEEPGEAGATAAAAPGEGEGEGQGRGGGQLRGHEAAQALLEECYDLVEGLMDSAEGLGHDAKALHHRLEEYRHTLDRMAQGPHTYKELLEVQMALNAVDDDRQAHAGVFAGQASAARACSVLLNHCYRLLHELYGTASAGDTEP